jgi:hypothetical protein
VIRFAIHMILHAVVPAAASRLWWRDRCRTAWLVMMATMIVDLDHLLARPVFDPQRCSLGFHPLHTWPAIAAYAVLAAIPRARWVGVGLLIHMALDVLDCLWMRCF